MKLSSKDIFITGVCLASLAIIYGLSTWINEPNVAETAGETGISTSQPADFSLISHHDAFKGEQTIAVSEFTNSQGYRAQVKLTCSADDPEIDRPHCRDDQICGVDAEARFFKPNSLQSTIAGQEAAGAELKTEEVGLLISEHKVPIQIKIGDWRPFTTFNDLEKSGDTIYSNAVRFALPTVKAPRVNWLFRFQLKQQDEPIDISINYGASNVVKLIQYCNSKGSSAGKTDAINKVQSSPPSSEAPAVQTPASSGTTSFVQSQSQDDGHVMDAFRWTFNIPGDSWTEFDEGKPFVFKPVGLFEIGSGNNALILEAENNDNCASCSGRLLLAYVRYFGGHYSASNPKVASESIDGGEAGQPPKWQVLSRAGALWFAFQKKGPDGSCSLSAYKLNPTSYTVDPEGERAIVADQHLSCSITHQK